MLGVVSWGNKCAVEYYPGVNVGVSNFVEWIKGTMEDNSPTASTVPSTEPSASTISSKAPTTFNQSSWTLQISFNFTLVLYFMYQMISH